MIFLMLVLILLFSHSQLGIHAREWISPAATTYIIKQLVERSGENQDLVDFYDFYILPVANPDG